MSIYHRLFVLEATKSKVFKSGLVFLKKVFENERKLLKTRFRNTTENSKIKRIKLYNVRKAIGLGWFELIYFNYCNIQGVLDIKKRTKRRKSSFEKWTGASNVRNMVQVNYSAIPQTNFITDAPVLLFRADRKCVDPGGVTIFSQHDFKALLLSPKSYICCSKHSEKNLTILIVSNSGKNP